MSGSTLLLAGVSLRSRRRLGLAATVLILLIAAVGISAGLTVVRQGAPLLDAAADRAAVAHLVLYGDASALTRVAEDAAVTASAGPFPTTNDLELAGGDEPIPIQMTALDDPDTDVNRPPIMAGRWAAAPDEVVLDRSLAADVGLDPGDVATFMTGGHVTELTVVGTAVNFTDCFYPLCDPGRVWVTTDGFDRLGAVAFHQLWLRFEDPSEADAFVEQVASSGIEGVRGNDTWLDTRGDFLTLDRIFGSFISVFGAFVLVCAAVVVAGSTAMRIVSRRREIGLLGAIGCSPREVAASLVVENVVIGVIAAIAGWALAGFAVPSLQVGIGAALGPQDPSWSLLALGVTLGVIVVVLRVATVVPARRAARRPVTDVLRDVPPARVSWLTRHLPRVPGRLELLGVQESAAQPSRSALAALAVVVAVVGTIVSLGFIRAIEGVADDPARQGDPWDIAIDPGDIGADAVVAALDADDDVDRWFTELERRSTLDEGAFLAVAVGGIEDAGFRIAQGRTVGAPGEAIAGYGFLQRFGVDVGDRVDILAGTTPLELEIVGWYRETEDSGEILRFGLGDLADAETEVGPGVFRVAVGDDAEASTVADRLAAQLGGEARVAAVDTGIDDMQPFFLSLRLIAGILVLMAGVNLLSTLLTASREASRRIGVELSIGFTPRQVTVHGAVAGLTIGAIATLIGVPVALLLFRVLADTVSTGLGVGPGWMPLPPTMPIMVLVLATLAVTAALGAASVARVSRRPASELIRSE
ncbi:MAG TPA: FtsX-like permease family protein [Ilumatobacter sp.]|nr:FtsX-like permease family protein [Ilumatobacter sp.]